MKNSLRRRMKTEEGKVMILALILLVVGGLVLGPLLGLTGTGLASGEVYERKAAELYAADGGVEDAIWKLQHRLELPSTCSAAGWKYPPDGEPYPLKLNGKSVRVIIEYLKDEGDGGVFRITSKSSTDDRSSTTIVSYLQGVYVEGGVEYETVVEHEGTYVGSIEDESVHGEGDLHVTGDIKEDAIVWVEGDLKVDGNIQDNAEVYVEGDLMVDGNIEGDAQVYVKGSLTLTGSLVKEGNIEYRAVICVGEDLTINGNIEDDTKVYVEGNLFLTYDGSPHTKGKIQHEAWVCVEGSIELNKTQNDCTVCAGVSLVAEGGIEGGDIYAPGYQYDFSDCVLCTNPNWAEPECEACVCCACPFNFAGGRSSGPGSWSDWNVTTYIINP